MGLRWTNDTKLSRTPVGRRLARGLTVLVLFSTGCGARTGLFVEKLAEEGEEAGEANDAGDARLETTVDANVAASLQGLRWELPCVGMAPDPTVCSTLATVPVSATMGGAPGVTYEVTLRFRGVVGRRRHRLFRDHSRRGGGHGDPPRGLTRRTRAP